MKTWQDVYKLPFKLDEYGGIHVFDADHKLVFQFDDELENPKFLFKLITGESILLNVTGDFTYNSENQCIYLKDRSIISVRGYGYLTGRGGLNLSYEEAAHIQDTLAEYLLSKLNGK